MSQDELTSKLCEIPLPVHEIRAALQPFIDRAIKAAQAELKAQCAAIGEEHMPKPFLYAIAEPDGSPYMSEDCVCQDREPLDEQVDCLNDELASNGADGRYKVVALYRRKSKERNT